LFVKSKETPRYRIQAVARRTGVPAATLRAWERRYGIPRPERTGADYRTYSEGDVALVEELRRLCDSGLSPSDAANVLRKEPSVDADRESNVQPSAWPVRDVADDVYGGTVDRMIAATRSMNLDALEQELVRARGLGSNVQIFERVLRPTLERIGSLWHAGEISVAHEHLATELINGTMRELLRLAQPASEHRVALLACFEDELHVGSLYGIAFRLVGWGCRVVIMGARTPPLALGTAVRKLHPAVVGLSVTMEPSGLRARELLEAYAIACGSVPLIVGGQAAAALAPVIVECGGHVAPAGQTETHALFRRLLADDRTEVVR
jgi:MerR family transcriptional regulator, light-induced transcriptional regulator